MTYLRRKHREHKLAPPLARCFKDATIPTKDTSKDVSDVTEDCHAWLHANPSAWQSDYDVTRGE